MGRVKIPMAYRTDDRARRVTLCKRKKGLYKKAEELAKLCGVEVSVVIVGDSCKPSQMVATGHGNYSDLPSTYRVLSRFSELVTMTPLETPPAALDARETLKNQEKDLEKQRREIEQLKRELAVSNPQSSLLADKEESEEEEDEEMEEEPRAAPGAAAAPEAPPPAKYDAAKEEQGVNALSGLNAFAAAAGEQAAQAPKLGIQLTKSLSAEMISAMTSDGRGEVISGISPKACDDLFQLARKDSEELKQAELQRSESSTMRYSDLSLGRTISEEITGSKIP